MNATALKCFAGTCDHRLTTQLFPSATFLFSSGRSAGERRSAATGERQSAGADLAPWACRRVQVWLLYTAWIYSNDDTMATMSVGIQSWLQTYRRTTGCSTGFVMVSPQVSPDAQIS